MGEIIPINEPTETLEKISKKLLFAYEFVAKKGYAFRSICELQGNEGYFISEKEIKIAAEYAEIHKCNVRVLCGIIELANYIKKP